MVINQIHAIGDILFCEPIFRHYWNKNGERPIVPLRDHLLWLGSYIDSANFVPMSTFNLDYESMDMSNPDYLPLRFANQIVRGLDRNDHSDYANTMPDKYILCGLDPDLWKTLKINFKPEKMYALKKELVHVQDFNLINNHSQAGVLEIEVNNGRYNIEMQNKPGYTVLDWGDIMMQAKENHHVSTSTFYVLQALYNQYDFDSSIYLYPRPNMDGLQGISKLNPSFKFNSINENI